MEYTLACIEFSSFVLWGYHFFKWQRKQIEVLEFIDFIQKVTVFNPSLLKTVMDVHGASIYQKSFKRYEEDTHFARGVGFVQGFVQCENPIKSLLNSSSKLILSKLTSESIFSNGEFSKSDKQDVIVSMIKEGFKLTDSKDENRVLCNINSSVDYNKALHQIHSTSTIRSMTNSEKILSWMIFLLKIVMSAFSVGRNLKGFQVGSKKIEKGIVVGQYMVGFGEIVFDRITKELRMDNPILFLKDKMQMVTSLKQKSTSISRNMSIVFIFMIISGVLFIKRVKRWTQNLYNRYKKMNELKRMEKTFELSKNLTDDYKCIICIENAKNVIFRPCLHLALCKLCYDRLKEPICPICKKPIESVISIYIE